MLTNAENTIAGRLPGRLITLEDGSILPLTRPLFRRSSGKYIRQRRLAVLNRWIRKGILQVLGSPWLPGFWLVTPQRAQRALTAIKTTRLPVKLLLSVTSGSMNDKQYWSSFVADPVMRVSIQWTSFESYAQQMKKKYRARLNKTMKSNAAIHIREMAPENEMFSRVSDLLTSTLTDRVVAMPENLKWLLELYQDCFGNSFKIHGFFLEDQLVGFISTIEDGTLLRAMHYGSQENTPQDFYSYAMFYAIRLGIEGGFEKVSLGRTATEIKSTYGAKPEENYFSFYSESWFFQGVLKWAQKRYRPKSYVIRSPFK